MGGFFLLTKTFAYIKKSLPDVIPSGNGTGKTSYLDKYGWFSTIIEISKTGIHGDLKETKESNMWDFLTTLSILRAENKQAHKTE